MCGRRYVRVLAGGRQGSASRAAEALSWHRPSSRLPVHPSRGYTMNAVGTAELARRLGVCVPTVLRWIKKGRLPRPCRLNRQFYAWPEEAIAPIIDRLKAAPLACA